MAITFINVMKDNLYDNLVTIIGAEFDVNSGLDINNIKLGKVDLADTGKFKQGFLTIVPVIDEHEAWLAQMDERRYSVNINYYRTFNRLQETEFDVLTDFAEHLRQLLANNSDFTPSGAHKWFGGIVEEVDYDQDLEELEELTEETLTGIAIARLLFSVTTATEFV